MAFTSILVSVLLCIIPLTYLIGSISLRRTATNPGRRQFGFSLAALVMAGMAAVIQVIATDIQPIAWLSSAPVSFVLLLLITFIGAVITRFSANYLAGEVREVEYYASLQLTLAVVSLAVISNHMLLLFGAWVGISLCLHRLLMFYPDRPRAVLAAHKKFLLARVAEFFLLAAALLLYAEHGTWQIDQMLAVYPRETLSFYEQSAAVFLALTALIKCAQMPVHGWLIQVVEAPTPVSALLHAGIINLGGYLLILFAPLFAQSLLAQWLILVVAGITVLLAGLIVLTRVSIKVRLAWSTTAQMGLMLVECALGVYELALLHLVAHSCYKAYAFLNAGTAVEQSLYRQMVPSARPGLNRCIGALALALALVALPFFYFNATGVYSPWLLLVGMLTLFLMPYSDKLGLSTWLSALVLALFLTAAYSLQKIGAGQMVSATPSISGVIADVWFGVLVVLLFFSYGLLSYTSNSAVVKRLWHLLFAGLYLDEWSTRFTLALWPTRIHVLVNAQYSPQSMIPTACQEPVKLINQEPPK